MKKRQIIPEEHLPARLNFWEIVTAFLLLDSFDAPNYLWVGVFAASLYKFIMWVIDTINEEEVNISDEISKFIIESIKYAGPIFKTDSDLRPPKSVNVSIDTLVENVNIHENKDSFTMVNSYNSSNGKITAHYKNGKLAYTYPRTKIEWDAMRHHIEFYEEDLDKQKFKLVE